MLSVNAATKNLLLPFLIEGIGETQSRCFTSFSMTHELEPLNGLTV
jgi:hypothetical protein